MAKYTTFLALVFCLLLVAATEMQMAEGKYCWKKNHKWHGPCQYSYKCSQHCKHWFGAQYGVSSGSTSSEASCRLVGIRSYE
ncbi:hypothetical protein HAX54_038660 [Datura stramonium]|uniref:Defensin n=1 Tax=Datura stramonium TaxID=4076 RepID=A0ABS8SIG7_DATST|nr:hypothetical protein [Datura stramonium]